LPSFTSELKNIKNKKTIAAKRSKESKSRCLGLDDEKTDDCGWKLLREEFFSLKEKNQLIAH
jgi:hypothetical protein